MACTAINLRGSQGLVRPLQVVAGVAAGFVRRRVGRAGDDSETWTMQEEALPNIPMKALLGPLHWASRKGSWAVG